ncbi:MAG: Kelch repeat-containing protein [Armatimonadota bacterium]
MDDKIYVIGGTTEGHFSGHTLVQVYDTATNTWAMVASLNDGRYEAAAAVVDGKIYVFGGRWGSWGYELVTSVEVYDPADAGGGWQKVTDIPTPRLAPCAVAFGTDVFVIGGLHGGPGTGLPIYYDLIEVYHATSNTWETWDQSMTTSRVHFGAWGQGGRIYAVAGVSGVGYDHEMEVLSSLESFVVPEPASAVLLLVGGSIVFWARRRWRRST